MNILIVEDESVAARRLKRLTEEILGNRITAIFCTESIEDSTQLLKKHSIDLLILDLNLHGHDGFEILEQAVANSYQTIIVSANTDRAIEAYNYGVIDFVPKPFNKTRLVKAFRRLDQLEDKNDHKARFLVVKNLGHIEIISIEKIIFLKGAGDYAELHLHGGGSALHSKSLESLIKILPDSFIRIHKSYITDLNTIKYLNVFGGGKYECQLQDGTTLPVSRTRYKELMTRFEQNQ